MRFIKMFILLNRKAKWNNKKGVAEMAEKQMKKNGPPAGGPGGKMRFEKPNNAGKTLSRLLSYVVKNKALLVLVAILVLISSGAGVAGTYLLTPIINEIGAVVKNGTFDVTNIIKYLLKSLIRPAQQRLE